jgi:orotate phosphoribosyltransferase
MIFSDIDWLQRLRDRGALLEGHFHLSSGFHSPGYVQCAQFLQYPSDAEEAAATLVERLGLVVGERPTAIVSPAIGGIVMGQEVARAWGCRAIWAERIAGEGNLTFRRGFRLAPGDRVVAVEDVITTAGSIRELISRVEQVGAIVVGVAFLVDRSGGRVEWEVPAVSLVELEIPKYDPESCPQCAEGVPVIRPGSRPGSESVS